MKEKGLKKDKSRQAKTESKDRRRTRGQIIKTQDKWDRYGSLLTILNVCFNLRENSHVSSV